jgi:hypothetical protein
MGIMEICKLIFQTNKNPGSLVREGMHGELFCGGGSREQAHWGNHFDVPYMPFIVTGELATMVFACFGRGVLSPKRQDITVRGLTPNSFAAFASPTFSMKVLRFMGTYITRFVWKCKNIFTRNVHGFRMMG